MGHREDELADTTLEPLLWNSNNESAIVLPSIQHRRRMGDIRATVIRKL